MIVLKELFDTDAPIEEEDEWLDEDPDTEEREAKPYPLDLSEAERELY